MDALKALKERHSIRKYRDKAVPKETIEDIIDCGRLAATARNEQPWEFVVVTGIGMRREIADIAEYGKFISQASVCVAVFCRDGKYYLEDGAAATQNILVASVAHGLGTCWVAGDKKPYADRIRELLGVPGGYKLVSLIALGYPAETPSPSKRPLSEVLHWEQW